MISNDLWATSMLKTSSLNYSRLVLDTVYFSVDHSQFWRTSLNDIIWFNLDSGDFQRYLHNFISIRDLVLNNYKIAWNHVRSIKTVISIKTWYRFVHLFLHSLSLIYIMLHFWLGWTSFLVRGEVIKWMCYYQLLMFCILSTVNVLYPINC